MVRTVTPKRSASDLGGHARAATAQVFGQGEEALGPLHRTDR